MCLVTDQHSVPPAARGRLATLMPMPLLVEPRERGLVLTGRLRARGDAAWLRVVEDLLRPGTGVRLDRADDPAVEVLHDPTLAAEAYRIDVDAHLRITAGDLSGLRHACQTLRQLLPDTAGLAASPAGTAMVIPGCHIEDAPRFAWRGAHLDVARHFMPLPWLFRFVDVLALHRLNVLHLHLTDDQGWRFDVRAYPDLTRIGGWRRETGNPGEPEGDGTPHGGYYPQDQLRSLVAHAASRGITVVPEIDLPGHVRALLAAYPEFGIGRNPVATTFGIFPEVLQLRNDTLTMVEQVFAELLDVFPSPWIHIGGDECPRGQWRDDPVSARLASARGISSVDDLQRWFTGHLHRWLTAHGRRVVGWDEILDDGPVPDAVVMAWRDVRYGLEALAQGNEVVMAPGQFTYFDRYQSPDPDEPLGQPGLVTWRDVVSYDPTAGIPADRLGGLLGVQGHLWSEYLHTPQEVEYMAFPRLALLAEVGWRGRVLAEGIEQRLDAHLARLGAAGVEYRPLAGPRPWQRGGSGRRRRHI